MYFVQCFNSPTTVLNGENYDSGLYGRQNNRDKKVTITAKQPSVKLLQTSAFGDAQPIVDLYNSAASTLAADHKLTNQLKRKYRGRHRHLHRGSEQYSPACYARLTALNR